MTERRLKYRYLIGDLLTAMLAWTLFFYFRKSGLDRTPIDQASQLLSDANYWWGLILVPAGWIALYAIQGSYRKTRRKARLKELGDTAAASLIGVTVLFFAIMLDDEIRSYKYYYISFLFLLVVHFVLTYGVRLIQTTRTVNRIHSRKIGFPTLLIGSGPNAYRTYLDLENQEIYTGNLFVGFLSLDAATAHPVDERLTGVMPHLGDLSQCRAIIEQHHVEEVIIALEESEKGTIRDIILAVNSIDDLILRITPDTHDLLVGHVKVDNVFHSPLITIDNRLMSEWQYSVKRIADVVIALLAMLVLSPVYLITAILVKTTSPGPVFYTQERIGQYGRPFKMHKFRSMYVDAEASGPALSADNDPRITPFGRFMRRVRLDEIPQFYNVLRGTMTMVGPRPERQYYIDLIVQRAPEYMLLQRLKPGITSWGQVRYGYASSVDEMVERLRYDLLYIENMSIATDIKILLYTVKIILQGRGK